MASDDYPITRREILETAFASGLFPKFKLPEVIIIFSKFLIKFNIAEVFSSAAIFERQKVQLQLDSQNYKLGSSVQKFQRLHAE